MFANSFLPDATWGERRRGLLERLEERRLLAVDMVTSNLDDGSAGTLRSVIAAAAWGDTVKFNSGITQIDLKQGQIEINKDITIGDITSSLPGPTIDADGASGIFSVVQGDVQFDNLVLANASNINDGGAIAHTDPGYLFVVNCTLRSNETLRHGGAIANQGNLVVIGSTFLGNSASMGGGAIENQGTLFIQNSTFVANLVTTTAGDGGGAVNYAGSGSSSNIVINSTFSDNYSVTGGSAINNTTSLSTQLTDTIIAHEPNAVADLSGLFSADYSLIEKPPASGLAADSNTLLNVDPLLAPLGDYGGTTQTMALLPGSPAIDAGSGNYTYITPYDQRDQHRKQPPPAPVDIGAFQSSGFTLAAVGGNNQSAPYGAALAAPLVVRVTPVNSAEPVVGGRISFSAPTSGASAALSAGTVTIAPDGTANVAATNNKVIGNYQVTASTAGAAAPARFNLSSTDTAPIVTSTGGPYVVGSEGQLFLRAQVLDPDPGQTLTINWDVNGDGTPDATAKVATNGSTVTAQATLTNAQLGALGVFNGLGSLSGFTVVTSKNLTVHVTASDGILTSTTASTTLTAELGPEGGMKSNGAAFAGQAANVQIFVPDGASATGPLHFSIALDQNALATTYGGASTNDTQSFTFDAPGTYTVFGRMFQPDGAFSDYTTTVDVYATGQQNALFVDRVYNDLLGRVGSPTGPDNSGPSYWAGQLQTGVTRQDVALAVMSDSGGEYDGQLVMAAFQQYLHRTPEPQALAYFVPLLEAGLTVEQFDIGLVSSDEYLNSRGGGTNDGFLDALFGDALGRAVDSGARAAFDAMFAGGVSRAKVADLVFGSAEYENRLVENMFESLLNRPADPAALAFFTGELNSGLTDQQVMAQIIGSDEFAPLA